jgi:hypothetical protein
LWRATSCALMVRMWQLILCASSAHSPTNAALRRSSAHSSASNPQPAAAATTVGIGMHRNHMGKSVVPTPFPLPQQGVSRPRMASWKRSTSLRKDSQALQQSDTQTSRTSTTPCCTSSWKGAWNASMSRGRWVTNPTDAKAWTISGGSAATTAEDDDDSICNRYTHTDDVGGPSWRRIRGKGVKDRTRGPPCVGAAISASAATAAVAAAAAAAVEEEGSMLPGVGVGAGWVAVVFVSPCSFYSPLSSLELDAEMRPGPGRGVGVGVFSHGAPPVTTQNK